MAAWIGFAVCGFAYITLLAGITLSSLPVLQAMGDREFFMTIYALSVFCWFFPASVAVGVAFGDTFCVADWTKLFSPTAIAFLGFWVAVPMVRHLSMQRVDEAVSACSAYERFGRTLFALFLTLKLSSEELAAIRARSTQSIASRTQFGFVCA